MSERIVISLRNGPMSDIHVYHLDEAIRDSKLPMAADADKPDINMTATAMKLAQTNPGEGHDNWLNGVVVAFRLTCSNKMWVELERYHHIDFISSQSTMHRIGRFDLGMIANMYVDEGVLQQVKKLQEEYRNDPTPDNYLRLLYSVPAGIELTAGMVTNYRQLKTMYKQRKDHRLPEWQRFCKQLEDLPYFKEMVKID